VKKITLLIIALVSSCNISYGMKRPAESAMPDQTQELAQIPIEPHIFVKMEEEGFSRVLGIPLVLANRSEFFKRLMSTGFGTKAAGTQQDPFELKHFPGKFSILQDIFLILNSPKKENHLNICGGVELVHQFIEAVDFLQFDVPGPFFGEAIREDYFRALQAHGGSYKELKDYEDHCVWSDTFKFIKPYCSDRFKEKFAYAAALPLFCLEDNKDNKIKWNGEGFNYDCVDIEGPADNFVFASAFNLIGGGTGNYENVRLTYLLYNQKEKCFYLKAVIFAGSSLVARRDIWVQKLDTTFPDKKKFGGNVHYLGDMAKIVTNGIGKPHLLSSYLKGQGDESTKDESIASVRLAQKQDPLPGIYVTYKETSSSGPKKDRKVLSRTIFIGNEGTSQESVLLHYSPSKPKTLGLHDVLMVHRIVFSPDGQFLASTCGHPCTTVDDVKIDNRSICIFKLNGFPAGQPTLYRVLPGDKKYSNKIMLLNSDNTQLIVAPVGRGKAPVKVQVWDLKGSAKKARYVFTMEYGLYSMALSADDRVLAIGVNSALYLYDLIHGTLIEEVRVSKKSFLVTGLMFNSASSCLFLFGTESGQHKLKTIQPVMKTIVPDIEKISPLQSLVLASIAIHGGQAPHKVIFPRDRFIFDTLPVLLQKYIEKHIFKGNITNVIAQRRPTLILPTAGHGRTILMGDDHVPKSNTSQSTPALLSQFANHNRTTSTTTGDNLQQPIISQNNEPQIVPWTPALRQEVCNTYGVDAEFWRQPLEVVGQPSHNLPWSTGNQISNESTTPRIAIGRSHDSLHHEALLCTAVAQVAPFLQERERAGIIGAPGLLLEAMCWLIANPNQEHSSIAVNSVVQALRQRIIAQARTVEQCAANQGQSNALQEKDKKN
jgi:WD40 repeat protein